MKITDKELHRKFIKLGNDRRKLTNQLLAILPEIFERKIYKKYAATIEEYAGKFGGLSKGVVKKRLRLEKYLKDKPNLKDAIKTEGIHKVALLASLATAENELALVDKLKNMSKVAVQELSKEVRNKIQQDGLNNNQSLFEANCDPGDSSTKINEFCQANCETNLCSAAPQRIRIDLEGDLFFMFLKLKKKYGEQLKNHDIMKKIFEENLGCNEKKLVCNLEQEEDEGNAKKTIIKNAKIPEPQSVKVIPGDKNLRGRFNNANNPSAKEKNTKSLTTKQSTKSRYISIHIRRNLLQKTADRCAYPQCNRLAEIFHHTDRFAKSNSHELIRPFCKIHHEFAHNGLIKNENMEIKNWQLQLKIGELDEIDQLYRQYRKNY